MDLSLTLKETQTNNNTTTPPPPPPNPLSYAPFPLLYHAPPLYKECLRNHAAAMGRHSLDGCGEFHPAAAAASPLTCAACGCHRNFHRREDPPPPPLTCVDKEDRRYHELNFSVATPPREKKRFRSRFSKEQKEEMTAFAERVGWKIRRTDDVAIEGFCSKAGVTRGVLKVWMHNNKNAFAGAKKKEEAHDHLPKNGSNLSVGSANGDGSLSSA